VPLAAPSFEREESLQWGEQEAKRGRKGSINRVLRAEHPLEIDSEVWWDVKKERITSKYCRRYSLMEV
jgi:hypothetical protein